MARKRAQETELESVEQNATDESEQDQPKNGPQNDEQDSDAVALAENDHDVTVFIADSETKRGYRKATDVVFRGTIRSVAAQLVEALESLSDEKASQIVRIEIRAADSAVKPTLSF